MAANPNADWHYSTPGNPLPNMLSHLDAVRRRGNGWQARCPAHDDENPSLSVKEGRDGRVLVKCHAGCTPQEIVEAAGMTMRDLFPTKGQPPRFRPSAPPLTKQAIEGSSRTTKQTDYLYRDAAGRVAAIHRRRDFSDGSKAVTWHHPDGRPCKGGEIPVSSLPLYRLPELLAQPMDKPVIIVEGEKATEALRERGFLAVSLPGGAAQRDFGLALDPFVGRDVILWPDNDAQGRTLMNRIGAELTRDGSARSVRWFDIQAIGTWRAAPKDDAFDYFAAGGTPQALAAIIKEAPPFVAATAGESGPPEMQGLVCLADVQPERVRWLWPGRIPLGKVTIVDGDPGLGKSLITCDLAARVSRGDSMPDGSMGNVCTPAGAIFLTAEDGLADTIRPRMDAAGANVSRIGALQYVGTEADQRLPTLSDIDAIRRAIVQFGAKLVIIDPVMAHLPDGVNSNRDQEVRRALTPLARLAEETGAAIVIVRHLNKAPGGNPLYRGGGSIGFIGAARSGLVVAADPRDEAKQRRILATAKTNLSQLAPSLAYHVESTENGTARIVWDGVTDQTAADLLGAQAERESTELDRAVSFLQETLATGEVHSDEIDKEAKAQGITNGTLWRAKRKLQIESSRRDGAGANGYWVWKLPDSASRSEQAGEAAR